MKLKDYERKPNPCFSTILFLLFLIAHHNRMMLVGVIIPGFLMTRRLPGVQRDRGGPCGFGVEAALLLPAPGDGRASAVFLDIQRGLKPLSPKAVQLVRQRPLELHFKPGFLPARATLSLGVQHKNLLFCPKMKDECPTIP